MRAPKISPILISVRLYFSASNDGLWIEWFFLYVLRLFLGNVTFNCGESFPQLIINITMLRILLTENNRFELRNVGLKRYPLIGCSDPHFGHWSTGWLVWHSYLHSKSRNLL